MTESEISICVTGDFCPIGRTEQLVLKKQYDAIFNQSIDIFNECDINVTNLECPLTNSNRSIRKSGPNIKAIPETINALVYGGFNVVALANNHVRDYGGEGVSDTLTLCKKNSIDYVGAGTNIESAKKSLIVEIKNKRIAIVNICEEEFSVANSKRAGSNPIDPIENFYEVRKLINISDLCIVIIHGGIEYLDLPTPKMVQLCRFFVEIGVHAVFVSHSHVISGMEVYKKSPIFYGLGNFIFDWKGMKNEDWYYGYMVKLVFEAELSFKIIPYKQWYQSTGIQLLSNSEYRKILDKIDTLSASIINSIDYNEVFLKKINKIQKSVLNSVFLYDIPSRIINKIYPLEKILTKKSTLSSLNSIRCNSYYEILRISLQKIMDID